MVSSVLVNNVSTLSTKVPRKPPVSTLKMKCVLSSMAYLRILDKSTYNITFEQRDLCPLLNGKEFDFILRTAVSD